MPNSPASHSAGAHFLVCCLADSRLAGEILPAADDHIDILRIELDEPRGKCSGYFLQAAI